MNNYDNFPLEKMLLNEIELACKILLVPSGQTIIKPGDRIDYIPLILKGSVRVYEKDPKDGREVLLYYVKENEPCLFSYFTSIFLLLSLLLFILILIFCFVLFHFFIFFIH